MARHVGGRPPRPAAVGRRRPRVLVGRSRCRRLLRGRRPPGQGAGPSRRHGPALPLPGDRCQRRGRPTTSSFTTMVADARRRSDRLRTVSLRRSSASSACVWVPWWPPGWRRPSTARRSRSGPRRPTPDRCWRRPRGAGRAPPRARPGASPARRGARCRARHGFDPWLPDGAAAPELDLFDLPLAADLIDGVVVGSLLDELRGGSGDVLLVQTAAGRVATERARSLVERCRAAGLRVDAATLPRHEEHDGVPTPTGDAGPLVDHTAARPWRGWPPRSRPHPRPGRPARPASGRPRRRP